MRVTLVFNPIAGAGRAKARAAEVGRALELAGVEVALVPSEQADPESWLDPHLGDAAALVVVGGDGTVRMVAPSAIRTQTPVFHVPQGTENLFSREFGMDDRPESLLAALEAGNVRNMDVGRVNGRPFLLMVSVGVDAEVVHDLATRRTGAIRHASYAGPILRQWWRWRSPRLKVTVDGQRIDGDQLGFVVIANSRQYGGRLDPCRDAVIDDGLLDAAYFPTRSRLDLLRWMWRCRRGTQARDPRMRTVRGRIIAVDVDPARRYQIDGDPPEGAALDTLPGHTPLDISLDPGVLPVLLPAGDRG